MIIENDYSAWKVILFAMWGSACLEHIADLIYEDIRYIVAFSNILLWLQSWTESQYRFHD